MGNLGGQLMERQSGPEADDGIRAPQGDRDQIGMLRKRLRAKAVKPTRHRLDGPFIQQSLEIAWVNTKTQHLCGAQHPAAPGEEPHDVLMMNHGG